MAVDTHELKDQLAQADATFRRWSSSTIISTNASGSFRVPSSALPNNSKKWRSRSASSI